MDLSPDESKQVIPLVDGPFHLASDLTDCQDTSWSLLREESVLGGLDGRVMTGINIGEILT
jgi:hypothetical protein